MVNKIENFEREAFGRSRDSRNYGWGENSKSKVQKLQDFFGSRTLEIKTNLPHGGNKQRKLNKIKKFHATELAALKPRTGNDDNKKPPEVIRTLKSPVKAKSK